MARYIYRPSGLVVEAGEGTSLPAHLFEPVTEAEQEKPEPKPKARSTRKRKTEE